MKKNCLVHLFILLPLLIPVIILSSGCSDTVTNSTGTTTTISHNYQARSEQEFVANSSLRAVPGAVLILNLEHLNSPADSIPDTGIRGEDIIPYSYARPSKQRFTIGDSSYFTAKLINESSGSTIFELSPSNTTFSGVISPGNYNLYIKSLLNYGSDSAGFQNIFIQPDKNYSDKNGDNVMFDTTQYFTYLKSKVCVACDLINADLHGADLHDSKLDYSDLSFANMNKTNLMNSSMKFTNLSFADMSNIKLKFAEITSADLNSASLSKASIINANFTNSVLTSVNLDSADCTLTDFTNAVLTTSLLNGTNFYNTNLFQTNMSNSAILGANFNQSRLYQVNLSYSVLLGSNFCGSFKNGIISTGAITDSTTHCWP